MDVSESVDVGMIFALSPPVAGRRARLSRSRRLAGIAAAVAAVGSAVVLTMLLLVL
jgi:hypothetical protein